MAQDFGFEEMQRMQIELQEKYKDSWEPISPETGRNKLLWLMIELGEAADIIKKEGDQKILENESTREHFIEEMADVLMYYNDVMLCYNISIDELKKIYCEKQKRNLERW